MYDPAQGSAAVTVTDDDEPAVARRVSISPGNLTVTEGDTGSYTVVLATQPTGVVTVTPASADTIAVTVSPAALAFTTSNWNNPRTVTVVTGGGL